MTMANNSNASPEIFGFDFQVNATIFLMLDNIKEVEAVRTIFLNIQNQCRQKIIVPYPHQFKDCRRNNRWFQNWDKHFEINLQRTASIDIRKQENMYTEYFMMA